MTSPPHPESEGSGAKPSQAGGPGAFGAGDSSDDDTATEQMNMRRAAAAVLDEPLDDVDLRDRISRPGMARSTRVLLLLVGAVIVFALGALVGRATAPHTGPGSVPDTVGTVESVQAGQLTVRAPDGTSTVLVTTPGTKVGVTRVGGVAGLRAGEQVTVTAERDQRGTVVATHVDIPTAP